MISLTLSLLSFNLSIFRASSIFGIYESKALFPLVLWDEEAGLRLDLWRGVRVFRGERSFFGENGLYLELRVLLRVEARRVAIWRVLVSLLLRGLFLGEYTLEKSLTLSLFILFNNKTIIFYNMSDH